MKILVADDSKTNIALLSAALKKLGHEVMPALSGKQAIELFKKERPDLIILDVIMNDIDGFECANQLRELNQDDWIPIIFLSSAVDDGHIAKGINAGGDDYLTKPFSEITLAAKIKAMQRISDMRQKLCVTTQQLKVLSSTDTLTGIHNRLLFDKFLKDKIDEANNKNEMFALLFIDLDNFKLINDALGHHIGDLLLKAVAQRLQDSLRPEDFIARMGGDEFAIILDKIDDMHMAGRVAQRVLDSLAPSYNLERNNVNITASIGIACYPSSGTEQETIVQNADIAMYHAKEVGHNNYQYFTKELDIKYKRQIYLQSQLKIAFENEELFIKYQPIINLQTKEIAGMEALLTWNHKTLGNVSPKVFIPLAEENGLINPIGIWVLKKVCEQGAVWHAAGFKKLKLAINMSPGQLLQQNLTSLIKKIAKETHFSPHFLEFEITETSVMTHSKISDKIIKELHNLGIHFSINDFGTGYSSLIHLKRFPITTLKIDKSFVQDIMTKPHDAAIVKSVIGLGKTLGVSVTAEGIETKEQLEFFIQNDCPQAQGFYLCKPNEVSEITKFLEEFNETVKF